MMHPPARNKSQVLEERGPPIEMIHHCVPVDASERGSFIGGVGDGIVIHGHVTNALFSLRPLFGSTLRRILHRILWGLGFWSEKSVLYENGF
jgi:hypothetical protein